MKRWDGVLRLVTLNELKMNNMQVVMYHALHIASVLNGTTTEDMMIELLDDDEQNPFPLR